ncbi:unnamed protein product [Dracunculus medinensis]|uniref:Uncharacterized protein n=1 Tax=Dracunculus medinensis TaxID=318479 RepID=A0A0N4U5Y5_DRAME|nr:unnamed protein product [Dracunculus medinensis]
MSDSDDGSSRSSRKSSLTSSNTESVESWSFLEYDGSSSDVSRKENSSNDESVVHIDEDGFCKLKEYSQSGSDGSISEDNAMIDCTEESDSTKKDDLNISSVKSDFVEENVLMIIRCNELSLDPKGYVREEIQINSSLDSHDSITEKSDDISPFCFIFEDDSEKVEPLNNQNGSFHNDLFLDTQSRTISKEFKDDEFGKLLIQECFNKKEYSLLRLCDLVKVFSLIILFHAVFISFRSLIDFQNRLFSNGTCDAYEPFLTWHMAKPSSKSSVEKPLSNFLPFYGDLPIFSAEKEPDFSLSPEISITSAARKWKNDLIQVLDAIKQSTVPKVELRSSDEHRLIELLSLTLWNTSSVSQISAQDKPSSAEFSIFNESLCPFSDEVLNYSAVTEDMQKAKSLSKSKIKKEITEGPQGPERVDKKELNMVWTAMGITSLGIITFSIRHRFG